MKAIRYYTAILAIGFVSQTSAQEEMDAFRFATRDLNGTARSMSMGGAFGALGGDVSALSHNPAGLGIYRSSEVQGTIGLNLTNTQANWTGLTTDKGRTHVGFDNFSYVGYYPTGNDYGIRNWNIGLSYNRIKNFNRNYQATGNNLVSLADYVASRASFDTYNGSTWSGIPEADIKANNAFDNYPWLPVLGYGAGFIGTMYNEDGVYHSAAGHRDNGMWTTLKPRETTLNISERGSINEYNFALSTNISDRFFIGATVNVTDINYRMTSVHEEAFAGKDYLALENALETNGTGYSLNIGVIARPFDALRAGVAYNSPKWYRMTDYYVATGRTYLTGYNPPEMKETTPTPASTEYSLRTPGRWIFSLAGIIGSSALLSVDYEMSDYRSMKLSNRDGSGYQNANNYINEDFTQEHTLKIGGEYKITPRMALRAGYMWQSTPMKKGLTSSNREDLTEVVTAGTVPHYTVQHSSNYITGGLGYRFTPNLYMDLAYIHRIQKQTLYAFSNVFHADQAVHLEQVVSTPAALNLRTSHIALTLGYRF